MPKTKFTCSACNKPIRINKHGFAKCDCECADPNDLDPGYCFLPRDLPEVWKPHRYEICNLIDAAVYREFAAREGRYASNVTISLGDNYIPE
ncbi:MAG: hypothetical protein MOGMAGMI_02502 [Candidatus Omnitrophica bacterium]|nr:hypothetical protein [Candidatus Omnitrophota bacterium]